MSFKLRLAYGVAVAVGMFTAIASAGSVAIADVGTPEVPSIETESTIGPSLAAIDQPEDIDTNEPTSLPELVGTQAVPQQLDRQLECLAGAIYFEARGESLDGQLAVGRVIVSRASSRRFPASYCGVVFQPSQFSFVRGKSMPMINTGSAAWRRAAAVAQIAHDGSWESPVEGALYFHATRVSPGWRLTRMARIDNHVFYR